MSARYVTTRRLSALQATLSPRDIAILATVRQLRLVTGRQLERLHFTDVSQRRAAYVLASLVRRRLLVPLPRTVGGVQAGSAGFVYALDVAGLRLATPRPRSRAQRPWSLGMPFLAHTLAITEVYARLVEAERKGLLQLVSFTTEPTCWRSFSGPGGARVVLKPDAYLATRLGRFEDRWFVEVDR